jgi:hypothetical protein
MRADNPAKPSKPAWLALTLVMPATLLWLATILAAALRTDVLSKPLTRALALLDFWFVIGVLIVMPLAGAILAALTIRRQHLVMAIATMLFGFAEGGLALLMQTAPPPVH